MIRFYKTKKQPPISARLPFVLFNSDYSRASKASLPRPQTGHSKSSGMSSHLVPGAMLLSGSPIAGSYSYPQGQTLGTSGIGYSLIRVNVNAYIIRVDLFHVFIDIFTVFIRGYLIIFYRGLPCAALELCRVCVHGRRLM